MSDAPAPRARRRGRWAVALLLVGFVGAFVPGLVAGERFVCSDPKWDHFNYFIEDMSDATDPLVGGTSHPAFGNLVLVPSPPKSLLDLVQTDPSWAVAAATLLIAALLFLWWRRTSTSFVRVAGIACGMAASAAVCALVLTRPDREFLSLGWIWGTVPAGGALMAAAFLVAPAPRVRDE
jgi:MFS superfamily sulfate permease-like transporter